MNHTVISVENVSKYYRLGLIGGGTLHGDFDRWWARVRGKPDPLLKIGQEERGNRQDEYIWALRDVSFEVKEGEVLGIIGRNGAGKSTLLKVLSRITAPTAGQVKIRGRVASLLEVGTGFHPELTGRENIYLNGAILGMKKAEIERKFDEIVAFSEVEKFIDTPLKRYSSGMYVRLAFAVAAHLEPEIMLVDEVLAVGDAAFQKKCLGKMGDVAKQGRTVLFVSHGMAAISALCSRVIVLDYGNLCIDSSPPVAIARYLNAQSEIARTPLQHRTDRQGDGRIRFTKIWIEDMQGNPVDTVVSGQDVRIVTTYEAQTDGDLRYLSVAFALHSPLGEVLTDLWSEGAGYAWEHPMRDGRVVCKLPRLQLKAGRYTFNVCGRLNQIIADWVLNAAVLNVQDGDFFGTGKLPGKTHGHFLFAQEWSLEKERATE